jgi:hypothetical protein
MKRLFFSSLLLISTVVVAQSNFTPERYLGYKIGTQFTRQDKVVSYFYELQKEFSKNMLVWKYGETYEKRDLILAYFGTEDNLNNLENIRKAHLTNDETEKVAIVWLSYNVHGNESSGTEAAMETAFLLLTKNSEFLKNTIIIMDPCLNPDGRDRYVNYYNQYGNKTPDVHTFSAEHQEPWPSGRPNHYLFDLNRDWAWMTQVESQQRVKQYNQWLPHVHVDFHEQGINEPYYFPPAAEPYHEVITNWQRDFQKEIGKNHASYFDKNGWLYFSKEIFDLLYPSYGDTYPTFNGSIGMTYEQGGSGRAGLSVLTQVGDTLSLSDRVSHHVTTGISTVEVAALKSEKLIKEYREFCKKKNYKYKSYVLSGNQYKLESLLELLDKNGIRYEAAIENTAVKGWNFNTGKVETYKTVAGDLLVSTDQDKGTLVNVLFEPQTKLSDSLTYDITAWSLPFGFGLQAFASEMKVTGKNYTKPTFAEFKALEVPYAYVCRWNSMKSAQVLAQFHAENVKVYFSEKAFSMEGKSYEPGTLIVLKGENKTIDLEAIVSKIAKELKVEMTAVKSGFADSGNDFGAYSVKPIPKQTIGVLIGDDYSSLSVGEIWHFFEQQFNHLIHLVYEDRLSDALTKLDVLFVPEGSSNLSENQTLITWIQNGGKLIVLGSSAGIFAGNEAFGLKRKTADDSTTQSKVTFGNMERHQISSTITGAIYPCSIDNTNPLAFGYADYHTMRLTTEVFQLADGTVFELKKDAVPVNGFVGSKVKKSQSEALTAGVHPMGSGSVVYLVDNPLFRGFWENGKLMVVNAIFMVNR